MKELFDKNIHEFIIAFSYDFMLILMVSLSEHPTIHQY